MSGVLGRYVAKFAEATHALPEGMHMNADYPFMIPRIVSTDRGAVTIQSNRDSRMQTTFPIKRKAGQEFGYVEQSSTFETMFNRKPARFRMLPFKDATSSVPDPSEGSQA